MASRKKTRVFQNYAEALARTEELAASGDQESEEFQAAAEAAAQFFLGDRGFRYFNPEIENPEPSGQDHVIRKWRTIKDLCLNQPQKHGQNHDFRENRDVLVERQNVGVRDDGDELDQ